ncbi:MAG: leucine-rich repeat domain-containing protein, partial [Planctomycetota bacterium]
LYHRYTVEQRAMSTIKALGGNHRTEPLGPPWLYKWAGRRGLPVIDIIVSAEIFLSPVSDTDLAKLSGSTGLRTLSLNGTQLTDAGMVHLGKLHDLQRLEIYGSNITDAGLAHLKGLTNLQHLDLFGSSVTDAGFVYLKQMSNLQELRLDLTQVTDKGIEVLQKSLPELKIEGP